MFLYRSKVQLQKKTLRGTQDIKEIEIMAEPAINHKVFGGAHFNWNQVEHATETLNKDGKKTYCVIFKTGVKIEYPEQDDAYYDAAATSREYTMWQSLDYDTETFTKNFKNAKITGSLKDDYIESIDNEGCIIDVANDHNDDKVKVKILQLKNSRENNEIILDSKDIIGHYRKKDPNDYSEQIIKGPGIENEF